MEPLQNPKHTDVQNTVLNSAAGIVRAAEPGVILSYDRATQRAVVQPILRAVHLTDTDPGYAYEVQDAISDVPVIWTAFAGGSIVGDLVAGDQVQLIVNGRSLNEWKATGNDSIQQANKARHQMADVVAIPLVIRPLSDGAYAEGALVINSTDLRLGASTASSPVALSVPTDANFNQLLTQLLDVIAAIPTNPAEPTASLIIAAVSTFVNLSGFPTATAATRVKAL